MVTIIKLKDIAILSIFGPDPMLVVIAEFN